MALLAIATAVAAAPCALPLSGGECYDGVTRRECANGATAWSDTCDHGCAMKGCLFATRCYLTSPVDASALGPCAAYVPADLSVDHGFRYDRVTEAMAALAARHVEGPPGCRDTAWAYECHRIFASCAYTFPADDACAAAARRIAEDDACAAVLPDMTADRCPVLIDPTGLVIVVIVLLLVVAGTCAGFRIYRHRRQRPDYTSVDEEELNVN